MDSVSGSRGVLAVHRLFVLTHPLIGSALCGELRARFFVYRTWSGPSLSHSSYSLFLRCGVSVAHGPYTVNFLLLS
jgi:hypothetical protein